MAIPTGIAIFFAKYYKKIKMSGFPLLWMDSYFSHITASSENSPMYVLQLPCPGVYLLR